MYEDIHDVVRQEVATLLAIIFDHHNLPLEIRLKLYDTMSYTVTEDVNPTSRKNALQFWKNVMKRQLSVEGMIDGVFPEVTFSKDSKRIVVLNQCEVKKRLIKVLEKLSETGCLAVLKAASEDFDTEVCKTVKGIVTELDGLLKKNHVQCTDFKFPHKSNLQVPVNSDFSDFNIGSKYKGRNILPPETFLDYLKEYLKPSQDNETIPPNELTETVLREILLETLYYRNDINPLKVY